jgi:hypothetical protein
MAWVTLIVILVLFVTAFVALLFAAFSQKVGVWIQGAFAFIDSLLGVSLHQVVRHLFPTTKGAAEKKPSATSAKT